MDPLLAQWYDPSLATADGLPDRIEVWQRARLLELSFRSILASTIPRRLGADATPEELRDDKRICRAVGHAAKSLSFLWPDDKQQPTYELEESSIWAAQIIWPEWLLDHGTFIDKNCCYIATACVRNADQKKGNRLVHRLMTEKQEFKRIIG